MTNNQIIKNSSSSQVPSSTISNKQDTSINNGNSTGLSSFFYSILPKEILGVPVNEIKKDLNEGKSQISSL